MAEQESPLYTPQRSTPIITSAITLESTIADFDVTINGFLGPTLGITEEGEDISSLTRISPHHRRSSECNTSLPEIFLHQGEWYSVVTLKGTDFRDISIAMDILNGSFNIIGLENGDHLGRLLDATQYLRSIGVETDAIVEVREITEFICKGKKMNLEEFRDYLVSIYDGDKILEELSQDQRDLITLVLDISKEGFRKKITEMHFFAIYRAQQVGERLIDLDNVNTESDYQNIFRRVFSYLNKREEKQGKPRGARNFMSKKDIADYMIQELPTLIAGNIGKMHKKGKVVHGFLTRHNISLAGSLPDPEGSYGIPYRKRGGTSKSTDRQINRIDYENDLFMAMESLRNILRTFLPKLGDGFHKEEYIQNALYTLYRTYLQITSRISLEKDVFNSLKMFTPTIWSWPSSFDLAQDSLAVMLEDIVLNRIRSEVTLPEIDYNSILNETLPMFIQYHSSHLEKTELENGVVLTNWADNLKDFLDPTLKEKFTDLCAPLSTKYTPDQCHFIFLILIQQVSRSFIRAADLNTEFQAAISEMNK